MTGDNPSVDRAIGRIEAKLDRVVSDQEQARLDRREHYKRMEAVERNQELTAETLKTLSERVGAVEEPVADFNRWRERGVGAIMLVSFVAACLGGAIAVAGRKIYALFIG